MHGPGASANKVFGARLVDRGVVAAPRPSEQAHGLGHGAAGPLLAGLEVDLGRLREAVAAGLRGSQR